MQEARAPRRQYPRSAQGRRSAVRRSGNARSLRGQRLIRRTGRPPHNISYSASKTSEHTGSIIIFRKATWIGPKMIGRPKVRAEARAPRNGHVPREDEGNGLAYVIIDAPAQAHRLNAHTSARPLQRRPRIQSNADQSGECIDPDQLTANASLNPFDRYQCLIGRRGRP
jgi:hypothetical protein